MRIHISGKYLLLILAQWAIEPCLWTQSLEVLRFDNVCLYVCVCVCVCVSAVCVCSMLCPASCLPLLRELAQWRCLLGWHRHHGVGASSAAGLTANTGQQHQQQQQQGSEVKGRAGRPVGRTKPLPGSQVSPGLKCQGV